MNIPYVAFDVDGTALKGNIPFRDVVNGVKYLRSEGVEVVFTTNNSFSTEIELGDRIFPHFGKSKIYSSLSSLRELLCDGRPMHRAAFVIGSQAVRGVVEECNYRISTSADDPLDVVVVTYDRSASFEDLELASLCARKCSRLLAANRDSDFVSDTGLKIACGPLVSFVEAGSRRTAEIFGKPSEHYCNGVIQKYGRPIAVVGDSEQDEKFSQEMNRPFIRVESSRDVETDSHLRQDLLRLIWLTRSN